MSKNIKLSPCPFCGGKATIVRVVAKGCLISCDGLNKCNVHPSTRMGSLDEAIMYWETRKENAND